MNENKENSVPNIWMAQENQIQLFRMLSIALGVVATAILGVAIVLCFRDPIVILKGPDTQDFYPSNRKSVPIEKSDVETFAKRFLAAMYVWNDFDGMRIGKEIQPFAEDNLVLKVVDGQTQRYVKDLKGKKLAQSLAFVEVEILADKVVCRFDRVLKIEGIPLVIPTEVTLTMITGSATRLNPMGIYVAGVTEHERAK